MDRRSTMLIVILIMMFAIMAWGNRWINNEVTTIQNMSNVEPVVPQKAMKKKGTKKVRLMPKIDPKSDPLAPVIAQKVEIPEPKYSGPKTIYDFSTATDILAQ